ncbi:hypothetical protein [Streptomyces sp. NPDC046821]
MSSVIVIVLCLSVSVIGRASTPCASKSEAEVVDPHAAQRA